MRRILIKSRIFKYFFQKKTYLCVSNQKKTNFYAYEQQERAWSIVDNSQGVKIKVDYTGRMSFLMRTSEFELMANGWEQRKDRLVSREAKLSSYEDRLTGGDDWTKWIEDWMKRERQTHPTTRSGSRRPPS